MRTSPRHAQPRHQLRASSVKEEIERGLDAAGLYCAVNCNNFGVLSMISNPRASKLTAMESGTEDSDERGPSDGTTVLTRPESKTERAPMYKVLLINDDYTPMEFVVAVLEQIFRLSKESAVTLMLAVHNNGVGVAGVYTYEIAETKAQQVINMARKHDHPLMCVIEKE